jgi:hypothetical protein
MFGGAASWGHVLGILHGEGELALETRVAHSVAACKLDCFVNGEFIVHANQTIDPGQVSISCELILEY